MDNLILNEIFGEEELFALRELGIDPQTLVFNRRPLLNIPSVPFLREKQFVCHLRVKDGLYEFDLPEKPPWQFKRKINKTERKLLKVNNTHMRSLMQEARKNTEFIERFNSELFFKHSFYKGRKITPDELFAFYANPDYTQTVDLSAEEDRQPFIALYAMTFYACNPEDLFTIDGIFSLQPERHSDNAKKTAGNSVFNLILRGDKTEMEQILSLMGRALAGVQPPRVNIYDAVLLSKSYTLFVGLSEMGRVFAKVTADYPNISSDILGAAKSLMNYAPLVQLCNEISELADNEDYRETEAFWKCKELY